MTRLPNPKVPSLRRRCLLGGALGATWPLAGWASTARAAEAVSAPADDDRISPGRALRFPRDFGSHPGSRTEWWYVTGWLAPSPPSAPPSSASPSSTSSSGAMPASAALGFQITFFRSRTDVDRQHPSRFAAQQLLFAHAAITDLRDPKRPRLRHDERIARAGFGVAEAARDDTRLRLGGWTMTRSGAEPDGPDGAPHSTYAVRAASDGAGFSMDLQLASTQPVLLQGEAGHSRKGPLVEQASHYYSQPQLATVGTVRVEGRVLEVAGVAWMDHEWSESLLAPDAVGWDWIGMNLFDGRSLTAFQLRRADGSALWAGGSLREAPGSRDAPSGRARPGTIPVQGGRSFAPQDLRFVPGRRWTSALTGARYPVEWTIETPLGRLSVRPLLDAQELDSRGSTGSVYWEGLSELLDAAGRVIGRGYLEMTGYVAPLRL